MRLEPEISVIVPIYNEEESIQLLCEKLFPVLDHLNKSFEIVCINDGSSDNSMALLQKQAQKRSELKIVNFRRNYGQTAAMMAGIDHARGEIIIPIDADLQNDPNDIPRLLSKIEEGFDVVSGWRKDRQDAAIRRNFVSRIANRMISKISGVHLHDYGCTLKAYKKDVVKGIRLYGEMHRFIPVYATWMGARVCEIPVTHHQRQFGKSKYGLERIAKVLLDLMVVKFLDRHFVKPIYVFGGIGLVSLCLSFLSAIWMIWLKFFENTSMIETPLPLLVTMTLLVGIMCILLGLLAEMIVRTYFESQDRRAYLVRDTVNLESE
ncbi:glycosyltransferase family 2 protein [Thalassospira xiamenensis]|uniref:glycosyltransferase family 2 protein n=1 Tax=Thalassospira xiamenensis TaxID=220697 RepID=UPI003AA99D52